tara:strand:- start:136 stop:414 length:279 start_codon:yes stop_codon:yes gene_type:complete
MLACNKAKKLYSEWKQDEWNTLKDKPVEIGTMYNTLEILMNDMYRSLIEYNKFNTTPKLHTLITKYKKANEYFDNYKYQSMLTGISNGPIIK